MALTPNDLRWLQKGNYPRRHVLVGVLRVSTAQARGGFPSDRAEEAHRRQQRALDVRFVVTGERLTQTVQCGWIRPLLAKQPYSPNCLVVGNSQRYA